MDIAGLPLHALVNHAAVVLTPLAVLTVIAFAVAPRYRYLTRWPTAVITVVSLGSVWIARISGQALVTERPELGPLVATHRSRAITLSYLMILFTVVVLVGVWGLGGRSGLISGAGDRDTRVGALDRVLVAAIVVMALVVLVWVLLTGDAGARAVWGR
ncbi:MAG: hypothetical protein QOF53_844 [Nocardioidaceae bacterium]|jgi:hypothetical protein|nr:hypothetical protein [Nocardioidaceae bacterium]